jgi:Adenylate cyclase, family 3 (some proteins contain HAMP domain)
MENMGDAVCVTNRYGELQYMNPAAGKLLGIRLSPDSPTKIWEAIPFVETNDELIQLFIEAIQTGVNSRHVLVGYQNTEGRVSRVRVSLTRLGTDDGTFLIVLSDLTELLRVTDAFKRYTSPQIADYVLHTPGGEARGGASREISVLFADLRGSTALSVGLSPERLVEMLNRFFEKMSEVVNRFGGTVIEFLGDSVFAVFGAPTEDPDHAFHAVSCAVGMQNALQEVNETNRACGDPELSIGIGVHTGECIVGNIGSREKMKYGCVGETVNLAARIESLTVGGEVLISETSASAISAPMDITGRREFLPKGAREPMTALEIAGIGPLRLLRHGETFSWMEVHPAAEVAFRFLNERKYADETVRIGRITALSPDGLYAVLRCEPEPAVSADLMIDIGDALYAKVTGRAEDGSLLCFTARPDRFGDWFKTLTGTALRHENH